MLPAIEYPGHFTVREITGAGTFRFGARLFFLSNSLKQLPIGLEEVSDGVWSVYFCHVARRGNRIAVVALARRLAGILYAMWRDNTPYTPIKLRMPGPTIARAS